MTLAGACWQIGKARSEDVGVRKPSTSAAKIDHFPTIGDKLSGRAANVTRRLE
jgi:hypothetical protein